MNINDKKVTRSGTRKTYFGAPKVYFEMLKTHFVSKIDNYEVENSSFKIKKDYYDEYIIYLYIQNKKRYPRK